MDNLASAVPPTASAKVSFPDASLGLPIGQRAGLYLVFAAVLLVAWLVRSAATCTRIEVPLYKASRWKWVFDAETLIRDSYQKVCPTPLLFHPGMLPRLGVTQPDDLTP